MTRRQEEGRIEEAISPVKWCWKICEPGNRMLAEDIMRGLMQSGDLTDPLTDRPLSPGPRSDGYCRNIRLGSVHQLQ